MYAVCRGLAQSRHIFPSCHWLQPYTCILIAQERTDYSISCRRWWFIEFIHRRVRQLTFDLVGSYRLLLRMDVDHQTDITANRSATCRTTSYDENSAPPALTLDIPFTFYTVAWISTGCLQSVSHRLTATQWPVQAFQVGNEIRSVFFTGKNYLCNILYFRQRNIRKSSRMACLTKLNY